MCNSDITDRKRMEEALQYQLQYGKLVADISAMFATITTDELSTGVNYALQLSGVFFNIDRSYIFQLSAGGEVMNNTFEWCAEGIESQIKNLQGIPIESIFWTVEQLTKHGTINIPCVPDMPLEAAAEKEILQAQSIQSVLIVPMISANKLIGFIGFDSVREKKIWTDKEISLLKVMADIISSAFIKQQAEKALQASEERYRLIVENVEEAIVVIQDGKIKFVNPVTLERIGYTEDELYTTSFFKFIYIDDQKLVRNVYQKIFRGNKVPQRFPIRVITKDGKVKWVEFSTVLFFWEGSPAILGFGNDITERKNYEDALKKVHLELEQRVKERTLTLQNTNEKLLLEIAERKRIEDALRESEEHFRQIVELFPVAILGHSEEEIVFANTAAANLIHVENPQCLVKETLTDYLHPNDKDIFLEQIKEIKEKRAKQKTLSTKIISTIGMMVDVELILTPFISQGKLTVQIVAYDLTKRKKMDEEIFKANKLEAIGMLAGGIAHDFNNFLATLLGNVSLARLYKDDPEKIMLKLENMVAAILRAKDLTHQLSTFSKGGAPVKEVVSINRILVESTTFALSGSNVRYKLSISDNLYTVEIDEGQISQVLYNIIINAVQAMPDGGTIWVSAENTVFKAEEKERLLPLQEGKYVRISIQDEGTGIPEKLLQKIFDPFFTTKPKGSGLGLATSYSIIKNHNGYLEAKSKMGVGTTFFIYLPASNQPDHPNINKENILYGAGKILVMDDEEDVRKIIGEMLSLLGYKVHFAKDGAEAMRKYFRAGKTSHPFDLVLMDLTIPGGMGGKQTIKKMLKKDPAIKAVVSSGYSDDPVMSDFKKYGFKGVIKKPFKIEELSKVIDEAIKGDV